MTQRVLARWSAFGKPIGGVACFVYSVAWLFRVRLQKVFKPSDPMVLEVFWSRPCRKEPVFTLCGGDLHSNGTLRFSSDISLTSEGVVLTRTRIAILVKHV